jgi:hypothetical protein
VFCCDGEEFAKLVDREDEVESNLVELGRNGDDVVIKDDEEP